MFPIPPARARKPTGAMHYGKQAPAKRRREERWQALLSECRVVPRGWGLAG